MEPAARNYANENELKDSAIALDSFDDLLFHQREAANHILKEIGKIADDNEQLSKDGKDESYYARPHQIFMINGERGMGKTSTLLTLHRYLSATASANRRNRLELCGRLLVLPLIIPGEMSPSERLMELVLGNIDYSLKEAQEACNERTGYSPPHEVTREKISGLRERRLPAIFKSWVYSEALGLETLSRDALDFEDYAGRRAEESFRAGRRIDDWRAFVDELLAILRKDLLVICFDDTDLAPEVVSDILNTFRLYLDHPRIISIISADWEGLSRGIEFARLQRVAPILPRFTATQPGSPPISSEHARWQAWTSRQIRFEIDEAHYLLNKLFPSRNKSTLALIAADFADGSPIFGSYRKCLDEFPAPTAENPHESGKKVLETLWGSFRMRIVRTPREWKAVLDSLKKAGQTGKDPREALLAELLSMPAFMELDEALQEFRENRLSAFLSTISGVDFFSRTFKIGNRQINGPDCFSLLLMFLDISLADMDGLMRNTGPAIEAALPSLPDAVQNVLERTLWTSPLLRTSKYPLPFNCTRLAQLDHILGLRRFATDYPPSRIREALRPLVVAQRAPTRTQLEQLGLLPPARMKNNAKFNSVLNGLEGYLAGERKSLPANRNMLGGAAAYLLWKLTRGEESITDSQSVAREYFEYRIPENERLPFWQFTVNWLAADADREALHDALRYLLAAAMEIYRGGESSAWKKFDGREFESLLIGISKTDTAFDGKAADFVLAALPAAELLMEIRPKALLGEGTAFENLNEARRYFPRKLFSQKGEETRGRTQAELVQAVELFTRALMESAKPFSKMSRESQLRRLNPFNVPVPLESEQLAP